MSRNLILLILVVGIVTGCLKPPDYPEEPVIEFLSLSKNTMDQGALGQDSLKLQLVLLMEMETLQQKTPPNLILTDSRTNATPVQIAIPDIPNSESKYGISGQIEFRLFTDCCIPPFPISQLCQDLTPDYPMDTVFYTITLMDRAGNMSNEIRTDPIYILCN